MTTLMLRTVLAGLACAALAVASPAIAETVTLKASLSPSQEVPAAKGNGTGEVTATYDTASKKLSWKGTYSGLTGPATMAHFHGPAKPGKNAGMALPIFGGAAAKSPFEGTATLTDAQAKQLLAGQWYVNVHTAANAAGEIRGQLTK
jgi:hypothetical protein